MTTRDLSCVTAQSTHKHHRNLRGRILVERDPRLRIHFEDFPHYCLHNVELVTRVTLLAQLWEMGSLKPVYEFFLLNCSALVVLSLRRTFLLGFIYFLKFSRHRAISGSVFVPEKGMLDHLEPNTADSYPFQKFILFTG